MDSGGGFCSFSGLYLAEDGLGRSIVDLSTVKCLRFVVRWFTSVADLFDRADEIINVCVKFLCIYLFLLGGEKGPFVMGWKCEKHFDFVRVFFFVL